MFRCRLLPRRRFPFNSFEETHVQGCPFQSTDKQGRNCLHVAANSGHFDMVQVLIGQGADPVVPDNDGWLPLHYAAHAGFLDVVKQLVESGSPSTAESNTGKTPIW